MSKTRLLGTLCGCVLSLIPITVSASTLYLANGSELQAIDTLTGNVIYTATTHTDGFPLAVRDSIWIGESDNQGVAREYDILSGGFTGSSTLLPGPFLGTLVDGAVNGGVNYTVTTFGFSGTVYQTNYDWSNPKQLFVTATFINPSGITYDSNSDTLWFSDVNNIYQHSLEGGAVLSQFKHASGSGSLAYDSLSDSLWFVPINTHDPLENYSTSGILLGTLDVPARIDNAFGAEFSAVIPIPPSLYLFVSGLVALVSIRKKK